MKDTLFRIQFQPLECKVQASTVLYSDSKSEKLLYATGITGPRNSYNFARRRKINKLASRRIISNSSDVAIVPHEGTSISERYIPDLSNKTSRLPFDV
ncbi:hypothetical protein TcasGA2_TC013237 [Tribolium castaneum]|uniref:Uncharacterized protein n=1 Tax=Tribolium castaneum TaxID=7070 RepID=D6WMH2_TRICA|nr:hypothetical protein TcasGA2_TC013237 [Tribolium castaneum]